jgi:aryl-alcohol dehydrogenase-like predicted oxidoreductase
MNYRTLPNTDLCISELGLGTMNFGDQVTRTSAMKLLDEAFKDYAINFIVCCWNV